MPRGAASPGSILKRTWYLRQVDVFRGISPSQVDRWAQTCTTRRYRAGERIVDGRLTLPERVLLVKEGAVRLFLQDTPEHQVTADILGPGQLFGVSAVFGAAPAGLSAEAVSDVTIISAEGLEFLQAMAHLPQLVLNLVQQVGAQVVQTEQQLHEHPTGPARVLLARTLLRLAQAASEVLPGGRRRLQGRLTRATLAAQVGCSRETVARLLSVFEQEGRVTRQGRQLIVHPDRLREVADGGQSSG